MTPEEPNLFAQRGWTFQREISVGNIITIVFVGISALSAYFSLSARTSIIEAALVIQQQTDARQDANAERRYTETQSQLERINVKLDRIIEGRRP